MTKTKVWMLAILFVSFFVVSCDNEDPKPDVNEAEVLIEWLESADSPYGGDYINTKGGVYMLASEVRDGMAAGTCVAIDIRSAADFALGHIEGAVQKDADMVRDYLDAEAIGAETSVALVCASGQTAAWLSSLLQMAGYGNVYSMKFGMSAWNEFFDVWTKNCSDYLVEASQIETAPNTKPAAGNLEELTTGETDAEAIFEAMYDKVIAAGFGADAITDDVVTANPENYHVVNYWPESEYLNPGHVAGAFQYTPKMSMKLAEDLKTLPTDKTIVVYCYTGQGSANMAAYLSLLGYDVKSLKYGANSMFQSVMPKSKWNADMIIGEAYVTGAK